MRLRLTRHVAIGAATAVLAAGGGVAYAASSDSETGTNERGTAPAAPGQDYGYRWDGNGPPPPPPPGAEGRFERHGVDGPGPLEGAADYLGLTERELFQRLRAGRTPAEIAQAQGRSVDGLKDALLAAARARLDRAVEDGPLTAAQRDDLLRGIEEHIDDLINGRRPEGGPHFFFKRGGPDHVFRSGDCPGPPPGRGSGERGSRQAPAPAPDDEGDDQGSSTTPGSWDGAASSATVAA
jgi:hypothetical protein